METYQRGLVEFDPRTRTFQKRAEFPSTCPLMPESRPGHILSYGGGGHRLHLLLRPLPSVRVPADPESLADPRTWERSPAWSRARGSSQEKLDRGSDGRLRYGWKKQTQLVSQEQQRKLIKTGRIKDDETLLNLRDVLTGKTVLADGGSSRGTSTAAAGS